LFILRKAVQMKRLITIMMTLVLAAVLGCKESPKGGSLGKGESFKIAVPTFDTKVKQGETQAVMLSLDRGEAFKQDVTLEIKLAIGEGISFDPAKVVVKAGDRPDVQIRITAPKNATLGEYKASVMGTPETGETTSEEFSVKVVASDTGYALQSDSPKGGSTLKGEGFKIAVPTFGPTLKQGETQSVTLSLERGESFKQDVTLLIEATKGLTFDPAKILVKAGDKPNVQLRISADKAAALSEYRVSVMGTPTTGQPTKAEFNVKVVAP